MTKHDAARRAFLVRAVVGAGALVRVAGRLRGLFKEFF